MAGGHLPQVSDDTFEAEVLRVREPVVVDFWAEWCSPCKRITPMLEELATEFSGKARIVKVDIDANADLATRYRIQSIPTLLFFKGGQVVDTIIGAEPKQNIKKKIEAQLG